MSHISGESIWLYRYRGTWIVISLIAVVCSFRSSSNILPAEPEPFDMFSYWGTVATLIALLITVLEIIQNAKISRTITQSINEKVEDISKINKTALLAEASAIIDQIVDNVEEDKYSESALLIRELQKKLLYSQSELLSVEVTCESEKITIPILERKIIAYKSSSSAARVTKAQKCIVKDALILLKQIIHNNNPGRR